MNERFSKILLLFVIALLAAKAGHAADTSAVTGSGRSNTRPALEILPEKSTGVAALPYDKVHIDPVAISFSPTSKYRYLKPELEARIDSAVAEAIRAAFGDRATVVADLGPGVIRVRAAITNVDAEEKPRRFWSYTPFGLVKARIDAAAGRDFVLRSATVEVELFDGDDGHRLAAVADLTGDDANKDRGDLSFRTLVAKIGGWTHRLLADFAGA